MDSKGGASIRPAMIEAETSIRHEWRKMTQLNPSMTLTDVIDLTSKSHVWHM